MIKDYENPVLLTSSQAKFGRQSINGSIVDAKENIIKDAIVKLFDQNSNQIAAISSSSSGGEYEFKNVDLTKFTFFVIAHHPHGTYNGVIADNIHGAQDVEP